MDTLTKRPAKSSPRTTCECGTAIGGEARSFVHFDDANAAISKSARPQCATCYATRYLQPAPDRRLEAAMSADADFSMRSDLGKSFRDRLMIVPAADGWAVFL
jgi:hypothetical protein